MSDCKCIHVDFFVGEEVYIFDQNLFSKYDIKEEKIMKMEAVNTGLTYISSNGYCFSPKDIGITVFHTYDDAAKKRIEVLNENSY